MSEATPTLTPQLVRDLAGCAGLDLPPGRAAALIPLLGPLLRADEALASLDLGTDSPVGPLWPAPRVEGSHD